MAATRKASRRSRPGITVRASAQGPLPRHGTNRPWRSVLPWHKRRDCWRFRRPRGVSGDMPNPIKLQFAAWQRSSLFQLATNQNAGGRLAGALTIDLVEEVDGQPRFNASGQAPFRFLGPQDILGLTPRAVL